MRSLATLQLARPLPTTLPLPPASSFYAPHCRDDASSSRSSSDGSSKLIGLISTFTLENNDNDDDVGVVVAATPISSPGACQALSALPVCFACFNATFLLANFALSSPACVASFDTVAVFVAYFCAPAEIPLSVVVATAFDAATATAACVAAAAGIVPTLNGNLS